MLVRDLMSENPVSIASDATLEQAVELMSRHGFRELPVLEDGNLAGILTDRDIKMALGPDARSMRVEDIDPRQLEGSVDWFMTPNVITVDSAQELSKAARKLLELRVGALPVVDPDGELVGMLSATDLVRLAVEQLEA